MAQFDMSRLPQKAQAQKQASDPTAQAWNDLRAAVAASKGIHKVIAALRETSQEVTGDAANVGSIISGCMRWRGFFDMVPREYTPSTKPVTKKGEYNPAPVKVRDEVFAALITARRNGDKKAEAEALEKLDALEAVGK